MDGARLDDPPDRAPGRSRPGPAGPVDQLATSTVDQLATSTVDQLATSTVDELVTYLAMGAPGQLRPAQPRPGLELAPLGEPTAQGVERIRRLHDAVAAPHHWPSLGWSVQDWARDLARPDRRDWLARVDGVDIGWARLEADGPGSVRLASLGLVPARLGAGYGGAVLTGIVREAWRLVAESPAPPGVPARVWVTTSSRDHPHALDNYLARGFRVTRRERWCPAGGPDASAAP